jgi:two-component system sensor histidine kinase KdpD
LRARASNRESLETRAGRRLPVGLAFVLSASALGFGYLAHLHGRPVTAALLAILSVTAVGALLGVRAGLLAGFVASIAYNLLFTDPYLRFSVASADDLVPIIALNVGAIVSGLIAGRLRDRAVAAERSNRRIADLLTFSQDLQRALSLTQLEKIIAAFLEQKAAGVRVSIEATANPRASLEQLKTVTDDLTRGQAGRTHFLLESGDGAVGELVIEHGPGAFDEQDVRPLLPIVAMATQRCILASEAAEADLLRRSEKFKTALLSSVSHDLRTPLAAISASASSLSSLGTQLDPDTRDDLLRTIEQQCDRLDRLTTNLLNLGRIDGGLDVVRMPLVDAIEVLGSVLARVRSAHSTHCLERDFRSPAAIVRADEALLEQLFFNVLNNAVTHTPPGTVIQVDAACSGRSVSISIEDDGPGIPSEDRERIFDRFYQGRANDRGRSGSGLGLSIARGFAEAVGGTIHAGRPIRLPHGTRIDINLPLAEQQ